MWRIMKDFNVLPTDPRFQQLTSNQIDYIINSMVEDNKEMNEALNKQTSGEATVHDNDFDYTKPLELPEQDIIDEINRQEREMRELEIAKLEKLRANGMISEEQMQKLEAYEKYEQNISEAYELAEYLSRTGKTMEEYKLDGGVMLDVEEITEEEEMDLDDIITEFDDDGFADLT